MPDGSDAPVSPPGISGKNPRKVPVGVHAVPGVPLSSLMTSDPSGIVGLIGNVSKLDVKSAGVPTLFVTRIK
jgi:hypothetical protein